MNGSKKKGQVASVEYARKKLMEAGLDVKINRESGFPTIVASKGEGGVLLWGHLDTERMKGMKRKEQGQILGDMIRGRGAANMKGAVAAMICAAKRLSTWQVPFTIVLTTDALVEQRGAESLALDPLVVNSKGILILAPTSMTPIIGQIGYAAVKVRTNGEGAVMNMADFLKKLAIHIEESSGRLSVKTGSIKGGKKKRPFESPGSCDVTLELKTVDEIDLTMDEIEGLMEGMEHEIDVLCQSEMMEFDRSSEIAKEMTELSKKEPVLELIHSEASEIVSGNQKITIWGPGNMATAVTDQEYVTLSELERTYEGILNLIDRTSPLED
jgi:acetylornithine deacetylase/succinyl-diaminopimelate desuccinylase-like protein